MKKHFLGTTFAFVLAASSSAQTGVEGFDAGNPDGWELWWSVYTNVVPTGGNPGSFLQLDDFTSGPATCSFVKMFPDAASSGFLHTGDWRAAGVDTVSIDLDIQQGLYGGDLILELISDPGTPGNTADDCIISLRMVAAGSMAPGWQTYTFDVPTSQTTMPLNWEIDVMSPCGGGLPDVAWNTVVQDVDRMRFTYDGNPQVFCQFTSWILGVDNIEVHGAGAPSLGMNYCMASTNSTGVAAVMSGTGSAVVANNSVTLTCGSMPMNSFGFFLTSLTQGFVTNPGGSSGNLCLGGSIGRFVGPGQVQNSGTPGEISLGLDLTQHPTPTGFVMVQAGETWNFTAWFRDSSPQGATSNFGDGYSILFQ